jgi:hypothetical protein
MEAVSHRSGGGCLQLAGKRPVDGSGGRTHRVVSWYAWLTTEAGVGSW